MKDKDDIVVSELPPDDFHKSMVYPGAMITFRMHYLLLGKKNAIVIQAQGNIYFDPKKTCIYFLTNNDTFTRSRIPN